MRHIFITLDLFGDIDRVGDPAFIRVCFDHGKQLDIVCGLKPEFLAKKISKIIRKKRPGYHYIIATFLQKLSVFARAILPPRWFAWVMSVYYKL